jgi:hypothetical protein
MQGTRLHFWQNQTFSKGSGMEIALSVGSEFQVVELGNDYATGFT